MTDGTKILLTFSDMPNEFISALEEATGDGSLKKTEDEALLGPGEVQQILVTLTTSVAFVLGMYFRYQGRAKSSLTIRYPQGPEISAQGAAASQVIKMLKHHEHPLLPPVTPDVTADGTDERA